MIIKLVNILTGIVAIAIGTWAIYNAYKRPDKQLPVSTFISGFFGGLTLIIGGIMFIAGLVSVSDF